MEVEGGDLRAIGEGEFEDVVVGIVVPWGRGEEDETVCEGHGENEEDDVGRDEDDEDC